MIRQKNLIKSSENFISLQSVHDTACDMFNNRPFWLQGTPDGTSNNIAGPSGNSQAAKRRRVSFADNDTVRTFGYDEEADSGNDNRATTVTEKAQEKVQENAQEKAQGYYLKARKSFADIRSAQADADSPSTSTAAAVQDNRVYCETCGQFYHAGSIKRHLHSIKHKANARKSKK